jgi:hypothetical protein
MTWVLGMLVGYCILDFVASLAVGRCVLPGCRCSVCRRESAHDPRL